MKGTPSRRGGLGLDTSPPRGSGRCRGCGAMILWGETTAGKPIPLDPGTVTIVDNRGAVHRGNVPHHTTCPMAHLFKRPMDPKGGHQEGGHEE